jgi:hypothetical protein
MTLKELIEKHGLPVKVQREFWNIHEWVQFLATNEIDVLGFDNHGKGYTDDLLSIGYTLYTEPKQKKVYYQAVLQTISGDKSVSNDLYTGAAEAKAALGSAFVKLLTDRPIEI